jgi:DNA-binding transcriptional LysR family regulator
VSLTQHESIDFRRLEGLPLVLPRRPAHWRSILDETAKSKGFQLHAALEADSLRIQKAVITEQAHLFALLGPFSVDQELRLGLLQASKVISPNLKRYVTLAHPKNGPTTQACKIVSNFIKQTVYEWKGQITTPLED